jgi:photosystem II stability/assembly factor-like uncharacterized protein
VSRLLRTSLALALCFIAALAAAPVPATAAPAAWELLPRPWTDPAPATDVSAFAPAGLVACGPAGRVALSTDGGLTWRSRGPSAQGYTGDLTSVDFTDALHGVAAGPAGALFVTADGGVTWRTPAFIGAPPSQTILDVDLRGTSGYAVGAAGTLLATTTGGESWRVLASPVATDLTGIAVAGDGTAMLAAASGEVLMGRPGGWTLAGPLDGPPLAVAATEAASWLGATPGLFVSDGYTVSGSLDASTLTEVVSSPYAGSPVWPALAWVGRPAGALLLAGPSGSALFHSTQGGADSSGTTGGAAAVRAAAPGAQSVAYVLDDEGRVARSLSAGRSPADLASSRSSLVVGTSVRLSTTVRIAAPGAVLPSPTARG